MPKVTESHAQARRQQILDAARRCFAEGGIHQTTMDQVCAAAELSPGAVYSYFCGKDEIVEAMYEERRRQNAALIAGAFSKSDTLDAFEELAASFALFESPAAPMLCRLDVELWAEALRGGKIGESLVENLATVRSLLAQVISRVQERGDVHPSLDAHAVARVVMAFFEGLVLQQAVDPTVDVGGYVAAMTAMMSGTFWQRGNNARQRA